MGKLIGAFAVAVLLATTTLVANTGGVGRHASSSEANLALDGGFRDGLFVGRFMAERGIAMSPPIGRWSTERDRLAFSAGYRRGYDEIRSATLSSKR